MSIKPIDFNVTLPKTQEMSISKHIENSKNENIVQSSFVSKDKKIKNDTKRVRNTEKMSHSKINTSNEEKNKDNKKDNKKDKNNQLGSEIDIRI